MQPSIEIQKDLFICAGSEDHDSCVGDSGSGLIGLVNRSPTLIGIVSYGRTLCGTGPPGIYTNVAKDCFLKKMVEKILISTARTSFIMKG